jgi:glycosyltransferase involved in cell wall biosynthesis
VVHNAVDLATFTPRGARVDLDALSGLRPTDEPVVRVGLVATFGKWKGHDVFLRALAVLPADVKVRGYVVGGAVYDTAGSQRTPADLHAQVRALGLSGRVGFTGFVSAPEAMRALDVVVHASTEPEPFGLVIAEAMACARAVVTSGAGGAAELVEPERDALVHEPGDPASLAEAIACLARDQYRRVAMGLRARTAAQARFDPDRFARQLIDIYEGVRHGAVAANGAARVHPVGSTS